MKRSWFVRGDIDGFFGLFIDNLVQLILIDLLCRHVCHLPAELVAGRILPGAAISILLGNLFYAWQARRLMAATGRDDVTALPYGINTLSLFAFILFVMKPIYDRHADTDPQAAATLAWQAGLLACFLSGVMECAGAFVGDWLRKHTPRAALLSALAGIALTFITMKFMFQIFESPAIAIVPMMIVLIAYASRQRLPLGLPGGLVAVIVGLALGWLFYGLQTAWPALGEPGWTPFARPSDLAIHMPSPVPADVFALFASESVWGCMSVIFPMALFNVVGSLLNLESAEAAGDRYETRSSLMANGLGTLAAALFGSAFPTTIYIGHPGWKAMGARTGYSVLNGMVVTILCLVGGVALVQNVVPVEATLGILLWIGLTITAQAFEQTPARHALAVAAGLIPALGAWTLHVIDTTLRKAGQTLFEVQEKFASDAADLFLHGVIALNQGFILTCMVLAATVAYIVDRRFGRAAAWMAAAAVLSAIGLIHSYELTPHGVEYRFGVMAAPAFAATYALTALLLLAMRLRQTADDTRDSKANGTEP